MTDTTRFLSALPGAPRALALNGGGTSGRATATFLAHFEESTGRDCLNTFDLIAGVSTGALLAAGFGLGMSAGQLADLYETLVPAIFPPVPWWKRPQQFIESWIEGSAYRSADLRQALTTSFGPDTVLGDLEGRIVIRACQLTAPAGPVTWCNWKRRDRSMKLVDVLVAACSAPTFFPPHFIDGAAFVDGAMASNNPSMEAVCQLEELTGQVDRTYVLNVRATTISGLSPREVRHLGSKASWLAMLPPTFIHMSDVNAERQLKSMVNECDVVNMPIDLPVDYCEAHWCEEMDSAALEAWTANEASLLKRFGVAKPVPPGEASTVVMLGVKVPELPELPAEFPPSTEVPHSGNAINS